MELYSYMQGSAEDGAYTRAFEASRKKYRGISPEIVEKNTGCSFEADKQCFIIESFGRRFEVSYPGGEVRLEGTALTPEMNWRLVLLNYFSRAVALPLSGKWISYKDQPGGNVFYPHIRAHIIEPMGRRYDGWEDIRLIKALEDLGFVCGREQGDLCGRAWFAPRIPVEVIFWRGDEDFPGAFQILFDSTIAEQMHIEDSVALCMLVDQFIQKQYAALADFVK